MSVKENMLEILEGIDIRFKEPLAGNNGDT